MNQYEDKSGQTVNSQLCSYVSLDTYNRQSPGVTPPIPSSTTVGEYVVPTWNYRLPYDTLNKTKGCVGYPTVVGAYGKEAESCDPQYVRQPCN